MKSWKRAALVLLSVFMLGCMTACSGENRVNDATNGSNTGNTLEEDIDNGADALEDGAEDLKNGVEDGAEDIKDGVENALDGDSRTNMDK
nr:hypothetical protein [uncultured Sellimonas sp.]